MDNYFESNDRFSISAPMIEELLEEIRDAIGGGSAGGAEIIVEDGIATGYSFSAVIPDGVTGIGNYAFSNCIGLTQINIPDGVTSIGEGAFLSSGLQQINIPNSVTNIGDGAFSNCLGLTQIYLPAGVTSIGNGSFYECSGLTQIYLPAGITSIGVKAFSRINENAVINCGFAEGAVSGAPWGADTETVTINYNVPQP